LAFAVAVILNKAAGGGANANSATMPF